MRKTSASQLLLVAGNLRRKQTPLSLQPHFPSFSRPAPFFTAPCFLINRFSPPGHRQVDDSESHRATSLRGTRPLLRPLSFARRRLLQWGLLRSLTPYKSCLFVFRGFDRAAFSRQVSGMDIEFLAILNGSSQRTRERVFFSRDVRDEFAGRVFGSGGFPFRGSPSICWRGTPVFRRPNCFSSPCAP